MFLGEEARCWACTGMHQHPNEEEQQGCSQPSRGGEEESREGVPGRKQTFLCNIKPSGSI